MKKIIFIALVILNISNVFSQKNCSNIIKITKDKFTGEKSIYTNEIKIMKDASPFPNWFVYMYFYVGKDNQFYTALKFEEKGDYLNSVSATKINYAYLKFADDSVVLLKYFASNPEVEIPTFNPGNSHSYITSFFKIKKSVLRKFTEQNIKGIRMSFDYQPKEPIADREIKEYESNLVKEYANCFVTTGQFNLNSQDEEINEKVPEANTTQTKIEEKNNTGLVKPTNDTTGVSIYKQWKVLVSIGKDGIPKSNVNQIIKYLNDGTFIVIITLPDGNKIENKGTFQLLNDNKIIVIKNENGNNSSAAINKLTNKEMELKGEDFNTFYVVY